MRSGSVSFSVLIAVVVCRPIDLILLDLNMPVMRGDEAARVLRDKGYSMPIVAITGETVCVPARRSRSSLWCCAANVLSSDVEAVRCERFRSRSSACSWLCFHALQCLDSGVDEILSKPGPYLDRLAGFLMSVCAARHALRCSVLLQSRTRTC